MNPMRCGLLLSVTLAAASLSQAATTSVYAYAAALDACRNVTECNAQPVGQYLQATDQRADGNGASLNAGVVVAGARSVTSSGSLSESSLGALSVSATADGDGPISRTARETTQASATSRAEFTDTLTVNTTPGLTGGYVSFSFYLTGNLATLTFGDAQSSNASASLTVSFQTPASYLPPSQGGNNLDSLKYQLYQPDAGAATLTTQRSGLRNGVVQPVSTTTEQLPASDAGQNFFAGQTLTFTQWIPFNLATSFKTSLEAVTSGSIHLVAGCIDVNNPACDATGGFSASADNVDPLAAALALQAVNDTPATAKAGLRWAGITSIRTAAGQEIRDLVTVTSGSGTDYLNEIQAVPAPGTLALFGTALLGVLGRMRRRHTVNQ